MPAPPTSRQQQSLKTPANTKSYSSKSVNAAAANASRIANSLSKSTGGGGGSRVPMGFSQAQFGGERLSPREIYSNPERSGAALRSVVNNINLLGGSPEQQVDAMLRNVGYGNPAGRAGMVGTFGHESAGFKPSVIAGDLLGDTNTSYPAWGMGQWRKDRQANAKGYLDAMGLPRDSLAGQAAFAGTELANAYPKAYQGVMAAQSPEQGVAAMNAYERPFGWKPGGNPANVAGWNDRVARANAQMTTPNTSAMAPTMASLQTPMAMPSTGQSQAPSWNNPLSSGWESLKSAWNNAQPQISQVTSTINNLPGTPDQKAEIVKAYANQGKGAAAMKYLQTIMGGSGGRPFDYGYATPERSAEERGGNQMQQAQAEEPPQLTSEQQQQLLSLETRDRTLVQQYMKNGMTFDQAMKVIRGGGETAGGPTTTPPAPWQFPTMITRPYTRIA